MERGEGERMNEGDVSKPIKRKTERGRDNEIYIDRESVGERERDEK